MVKKKTVKSATQTEADASLGRQTKLRDQARRLVRALQQYAKTCSRLAERDVEAAEGILQELISTKRVSALMKDAPGPLQEDSLLWILRELASGTRSSWMRPRVAFLGPLHSYSHLATLRHFGQTAEMIPVHSISAVFEEVATGMCSAGVVPIENSTDGRIVDTLDMFTRCRVKICGEVPFRVHHNLLGKGSRSEIVEVCSKPQALSQCREWLATHLPDAKLTPMSSTTAAAARASSEKNVGAVASRQAASEYNLNVLASNIEDNKDNVTRFAVIAADAARRTRHDKTSLMFELSHEPGALADVMVIFKRNKLNLTWIESFPKPSSPSEYLFFVEFVGHQSDLRVRKALASLDKKTVGVEVLGSYPIAAVE